MASLNSIDAAWVARDLKHVWHPCTQMKWHDWLPMIPIRSGKGVWLESMSGDKYLDAVSSWWVNLFGHSNPVINQALKTQIDQLEHCIFAGFTHEPAIVLAEKLCERAPAGLVRCFFADNGSSAVEVALKMSCQYWRQRGKMQKTGFANLQNSYHGETLGALAVGDVDLYKQHFGPLLMPVVTLPTPDAFYREENESAKSVAIRQFEKAKIILEQHRETLAAVIVEPLVQCAGGMRMHHPVYLTLLRQLCTDLEIHLILDEIAVGFGRTGTLFASEQANISPDFLCLSKGLTGGYLPLSVTLTHDEIYQAFYSDSIDRAFLHSHSYTGNPLACSVGVATLNLLSAQQLAQNQKLSQAMSAMLATFKDHPHALEVRQCGLIGAIEWGEDKKTRRPLDLSKRFGLSLYQEALQQGALLRPLGPVSYVMPPYVITESEIAWLGDVLHKSFEKAWVKYKSA